MASLHSMPAELVHTIANGLPIRDILSLRLTCRTLCAKVSTDKRFEQCFVSRICDMSTPSLEKLASIVAHPSLRHHVRYITLVTTLLDDSGLRRAIEESPHCYYDSKISHGEMVAAARDLLDAYTAQTRDRERLAASGRDLDMLTTIFGALGRHKLGGLVLEAAVFRSIGDLRAREERLHATQANEQVGDGDDDDDDDDNNNNNNNNKSRAGGPIISDRNRLRAMVNHDFAIMILAMVRSGVAVENIAVCPGFSGGGLLTGDLGTLLMKTVSAAELEAAFSSVRSLIVSITPRSSPTQEDDKEGVPEPESFTDKSGHFPQLLASAGGLRSLGLRRVEFRATFRDGALEFFSAIARSAAVSNLRHLTLCGFKMRADDLLHLFQRCGNLEELDFREADLAEGRWSQVFQLLGNMVQLRQVTLFRCYEGHLVCITKPAKAGTQGYPETRVTEFTAIVKMSRSQIQEGVEYHLDTVLWKGSPEHLRYELARRLQYMF